MRPTRPSRTIAARALLLAFFLSGCSSAVDQQPNIKLNPHPKQRYELIVTVDAPGAWDKVTASAAYEVSNEECVPKAPLTGGRNVPNTVRLFELTRVDDKTYRGYFYRDLLQDEDYFGIGTCHWDITSVGPDFVVHGRSFSPDAGLSDMLSGKPYIAYFKIRDYFNRTLNNKNVGSALQWRPVDENIIEHPKDYFSVVLTVKRSAL